MKPLLVDMGVATNSHEVGVVGQIGRPAGQGAAVEDGVASTMSGRCVPPPV